MHRARTGNEYETLYVTLFEPLCLIALSEEAANRALEVQRETAATKHGYHLRPAVDFLMAATAELAGDEIVLWFFDRDLRLICRHTGQPYEAEDSGTSR